MRELGNEEIRKWGTSYKLVPKCIPLKVTHLRHRKITEKNGRELRRILMKKGYEKGGVSL